MSHEHGLTSEGMCGPAPRLLAGTRVQSVAQAGWMGSDQGPYYYGHENFSRLPGWHDGTGMVLEGCNRGKPGKASLGLSSVLPNNHVDLMHFCAVSDHTATDTYPLYVSCSCFRHLTSLYPCHQSVSPIEPRLSQCQPPPEPYMVLQLPRPVPLVSSSLAVIWTTAGS